MEQHFILCGLGYVGWRVLDYLRAAGAPVVCIDNRCAPTDPRLQGVPLIQGDCRQQDVLLKAGLDRARGVLILISDDLISITATLMVRRLRPDVRVVVRMFNQNLVPRLGGAVQNVFAQSTSALTAPLLALIARTGEAVGAFTLEDGRRQQVAQLQVRAGIPPCGLKIIDLCARHELLAVAHVPAGEPVRFLHDVEPEQPLAAGDQLVVCGEPRHLQGLIAQAEGESLPELIWAGLTRRLFRVGWRTLAEVDLSVKLCTTVLLVVIVASTLILTFGIGESAADAFYRTVSLMATGADMGGARLEAGGWQKVFVSVLRLVGTGLVAAFTAILTNYLVRAHLRGALEVRRIPDRGHIVVCGLGNVGYRVVEELLRQGERVVAVEHSPTNPFIPTARRQGAAVIVGDATVEEVLRQANAASARAVVAASSNELVNLEIVLLARQVNPGQRVVLRLRDPGLAETIRQAANIQLALSVPELAAPAFVAGLYGDRVRSVFFVHGRLLAVVDLKTQPGDGLLDGRPVRALAVDYQLLPVGLRGADQVMRAQPLNARLRPGDCLTAVIGLPDLQRLLQREPAPRAWQVEVTAVPPPARPFLAQLLRTRDGLDATSAEARRNSCRCCSRIG